MLFSILIALAAPTAATDICLAMVPPRLAAMLVAEHPDHRLPLLPDAPVERLLANSFTGGWPCPFVAIADVDGDEFLDRAIALKHKSDPTVRFIVARNDEGKWKIALHKDWPIAIASLTVEPLEAGFYEQTKGGRDASRQIDQLKSIQSDHAGFLAGSDEGGKQAFFFVNEKWEEIWLRE